VSTSAKYLILLFHNIHYTTNCRITACTHIKSLTTKHLERRDIEQEAYNSHTWGMTPSAHTCLTNCD